MDPLALLAATTPAAGAPAAQIAIASFFASGFTALLFWLVSRHRAGRSAALTRLGSVCASAVRLEPWAATGVLVGTAALLSGAFGVFWDVSLHIGQGRDEGPLANPSHYFILLALYGIFAAGVLSTALHDSSGRPSPRAVRLPGGVRAPVGGLLLIACGAFALTGFPLDDVWHRMFGQDVTLWGPTHLIMINGAILSVPVLSILTMEGLTAAGTPATRRPRSALGLGLRLVMASSLLFAISFWATEFDWGVPQYRMVWQPLLLALAPAVSLVAARMWIGRGGAAGAMVAYVALRAAMALAVTGLGEVAPAMPIFVVEALVVEAVLWRWAPGRPILARGAVAGVAVGGLGFAAQYAWSAAVMPLPWTPSLLAEGIPTALAAGLAGGGLGALMGAALCGTLPPRSVRRPVALGAAAVLVALGVNSLWVTDPGGLRATVALTPEPGASDGRALVSARISPASATADPQWLSATAWQGGGIQVRRMREVEPGLWRSNGSVPLSGEWKTALRLQRGRTLVSLALHLPRDPAVPTPGVTRPPRFTAPFQPDVEVLQTERRDYVPGWLWTPAVLIVLALCAGFIAVLWMGIARVGEARDPSTARAPRVPTSTPARAEA